MAATVRNVVTSGVFQLDGGSWDVENNVWIVGDDTEVIVIDAAHDASRIADAIGDATVRAIVCTHAHNDHVNAAPELAKRTAAPILLHPDDRVLWELTHPGRAPDGELSDGQSLSVAGTELRVLHTPGHAPGAVCLHAPDLGVVFTGDTLFHGGPGATGRSYSDYPTIVASITRRLFELPAETVVHTGHGEDTTIGAEQAGSRDWEQP
ncbi:glyoxylase-like metal-dependent hydrolase (beta-lactamase superfamily II) [Saccharomonospora amisosensis]|uniref:Glyoxylase-like metal-dependent hydrolase (Beta-lactamase superfamily II) n=1 Tax=Saccharomonospora amisosensis TaxID=1128677 RepID=A0A7X5ZPG1_9PSEU|nr:MBL fold metallo-hydrolase [Saccharomonospora amisosensis]NIJ10692.1 glyoxylase-like metal-dependent hydrolase (beta-lactamase superfamily II) [Saccharomonospora amisosensis]